MQRGFLKIALSPPELVREEGWIQIQSGSLAPELGFFAIMSQPVSNFPSQVDTPSG